MKKKLTIKSTIFYVILIVIMIPFFRHAEETNLLSHSYTSEEVKTFLKEEYSYDIQLENYKLDKAIIEIKEENSRPVLYYFFATDYSKDQEDLIFNEVSQIYKKMKSEEEIIEHFYKIRFRALRDDKVIYKHTYRVVSQTMKRIIYISLMLIIGFAFRFYYGIKATIRLKRKREFWQGDEIYSYSKNELERYLQTYPKDDRAYMSLSEIYISEGNVREALDAIAEANELNPHERAYMLHYGYILILIEEYEEALGVHNRLVNIKTFFTDYSLLYIIAFLYHKKGKMRIARRYYKHAYRVCKKRRFRNDDDVQKLKKELEKILKVK